MHDVHCVLNSQYAAMNNKATVFVTNIQHNITESGLEETFKQVCTVDKSVLHAGFSWLNELKLQSCKMHRTSVYNAYSLVKCKKL